MEETSSSSSIVPLSGNDVLLLDLEAIALDRQCVKCDQKGILSAVDPKKAVYCRPCFDQMVKHKFRSTLGKRRVYKDGANKETLLVFDGSPSSALALGQIIESANEGSHRKLMIAPSVLCPIYSTDLAVIEQISIKIRELRKLLVCDWYIVHVAACMNQSVVVDCTGAKVIGVEKIDSLKELLSSFQSPSCKAETLRIAIERLAARYARTLWIGKVMFPTNGDDLGRHTITSFCVGRGSQVSDLTNVCEKRHNVTLLRPLHDICEKEVLLLNRLNGYDNFCIPENVMTLEEKSVQKVADDFVNTLLEEGFKSTTSTLLATAAKVHSKVVGKQKCDFCAVAVQEIGLCDACEELRSECGKSELFDQLIDN